MSSDVTIVMPTFQGYHWLEETLPAIVSQQFDGIFEILAIDSSSTDGTVSLLKKHGARILSINQSQFSHGYARNLGIAHTDSPLIIIMSQDALPVGQRWLEGMVRILDDPKIGAAHVQQVARPDATPLECFFHETLYPSKKKIYSLAPNEPITLDKLFFSNVCSIIRRDLCLRFPFPENLIMSEDQAFARALLEADYYTMYSPDVQVIHSHHYDLITLFRRNFDSAYSLLGITDDSIGSSSKAGIQYILDEIRYLIRLKQWKWLFYVPLYEGTRIAGRILGSKADAFPLGLRTRLSLHRGFWTRDTDRDSMTVSNN